MKVIKLFLLVSFICLFTKVKSQSFVEVQKIVASDRTASDFFATDVSISGDYAIVGAFFEDEDADGLNTLSGAGSAYIYERDGGGVWNQVQKVVASDRAANDQFGFAVSISGRYAIVGANQEDEDAGGLNTLSAAGSAYIFERDVGGTWNEVQKIVPADRASGDSFGRKVSISGNYVIVTAYTEDEDENGLNTLSAAGSAYIFERNTGGVWNEVQKVVASDRASQDQLGVEVVTIAGNYAVVTAPGEDEDEFGNNTLSNSGSAYIFERDGGGAWSEVQKIVAPIRATNDWFGWSASVSGDYIIVGSHQDDEDENEMNTLTGAGAVYIFNRDGGGTWNMVQKIVASDRAVNDHFGYRCAISGDYLVVGAVGEDEDALGMNTIASAGSVYVFKKDGGGTWNEIQKIVASDRGASDQFSQSIAISGGNNIIAGAYFEDEDENGLNTLTSSGSAYIFCGNSGTCTSVLPTELTIFIAQWNNESQTEALLSWQTKTEISNEFFYLERSVDAIHFEDVARIEGAGDSQEEIDYIYVDDNLPNEQSTLFYRLRQQDFDGSIAYSQIEVLQPKEGLDLIRLYPNPNFGKFEYIISSSLDTEINVRITDYLGKTIREETASIAKGVNEFSANLEELSAASYVIHVETIDGLYHVSTRFVMQEE